MSSPGHELLSDVKGSLAYFVTADFNFVDISDIFVDHHCLNFLFTINIENYRIMFKPTF
jgi:hypothetical protein